MNKEEIEKKLEGIKNTIWAYKFEFTDLDENHRTSVLESYEKEQRLLAAKLKAIEIKRKLSE